MIVWSWVALVLAAAQPSPTDPPTAAQASTTRAIAPTASQASPDRAVAPAGPTASQTSASTGAIGPAALLEALAAAGRPAFGEAGDWAEYAELGPSGPVLKETVRFMLVEDAGLRWLELWGDKLGTTALRVCLDARCAVQGDRIFYKQGGRVMALGDLSGENLLPTGPEAEAAPDEDEDEQSPGNSPPRKPVKRTLRTLAGAFECSFITGGEGAMRYEVCATTEVPVLGLVRMNLGGKRLELVAKGTQGGSAFPAQFKAIRLPLNNLAKIAEALQPIARKPAEPSTPAGVPVPAAEASTSQSSGPANPSPSSSGK